MRMRNLNVFCFYCGVLYGHWPIIAHTHSKPWLAETMGTASAPCLQPLRRPALISARRSTHKSRDSISTRSETNTHV